MKTSIQQRALEEKIIKVLEQARHRGMEAAEAQISVESGFSVSVRSGEVERVEHHQAKSLHITIYNDQRSGSAATSDLSIDALFAAVDKACAIARYAGQDPFSGLADPQLMAEHYPDLKLYHPWSISPKDAIEIAIECDVAARHEDPRITDAEGSHLSTYDSFKVYGNTHGFIGSYPQSLQSIACSVVAQSGDKMQNDHEYTTARSHQELDDAILVGKQAARKVIQRLESRRLTTRRCPVIFHAPMAKSLLSHFIAAISGRNLYQKSSFLLDHLHKPVFPQFVEIYQQPHLISGLGSAPFDGEGVRTRDIHFVQEGILQNYVLASYSARKLGMVSTGNAGGVFNLNISHSGIDLAGLFKQMQTGLFVTDLMGQGINIVTGAYSRGAAGFWIENGEIQFPVDEVTVAGGLKEMFANIIAVANDTDNRGSIRSGSILISEMMIAGE